MAVQKIITDLEKLDYRANEIDVRKQNLKVRETVVDLKHTIEENQLTCLTAPQIGVNARIMCVNFNGDIRSFINPMMVGAKGYTLSRENCPSIPNQEYIVPRNSEVTLQYQTPLGKLECKAFKGKAAFVVASAIQALDGLYISDIGLPVLEGWDDMSDEDKDVIIKEFLESLDLKEKEIKKDIEETKELKDTFDAINFMEGVAKGEIKVVRKPIEEVYGTIVEPKDEESEKAENTEIKSDGGKKRGRPKKQPNENPNS